MRVECTMSELPVHIRPTVMDDLDAVVGVHTFARTAYYREGGLATAEVTADDSLLSRFNVWARAIQLPGKTTLCAERGGDVVGVLGMGGQPLGATFDLLHLHVRPELWGQGIGSRLHAAYIEALCDSGASRGELSVWDRNDRARSFYARRGWRTDGTVDTTQDGLRHVRLRLDLD